MGNDKEASATGDDVGMPLPPVVFRHKRGQEPVAECGAAFNRPHIQQHHEGMQSRAQHRDELVLVPRSSYVVSLDLQHLRHQFPFSGLEDRNQHVPH